MGEERVFQGSVPRAWREVFDVDLLEALPPEDAKMLRHVCGDADRHGRLVLRQGMADTRLTPLMSARSRQTGWRRWREAEDAYNAAEAADPDARVRLRAKQDDRQAEQRQQEDDRVGNLLRWQGELHRRGLEPNQIADIVAEQRRESERGSAA